MNIILKRQSFIAYKSISILQIKMKILNELSHLKIIHKIFFVSKIRYVAKLPTIITIKITLKDWNLS